MGASRKKGKQMTSADIAMLLFAVMVLTLLMQLFPAKDATVAGDLDRARKLIARMAPEEAVVTDGDTVTLKGLPDEPPLRLLGVNAPELDECYGPEAKRQLRKVVRGSDKLRVRYDSRLKARRFGRTLAYLDADERFVNVWLVRHGYARPYFIDGERGDHHRAIKRAAKTAKRHRRGLWGACPQNTTVTR